MIFHIEILEPVLQKMCAKKIYMQINKMLFDSKTLINKTIKPHGDKNNFWKNPLTAAA